MTSTPSSEHPTPLAQALSGLALPLVPHIEADRGLLLDARGRPVLVVLGPEFHKRTRALAALLNGRP